MNKLFCIAVLLLLLVLCDLSSAVRQGGRGGGASQELKSFNLSHPLIISIAAGELRNNIVTEFEIGLAGAKFGLGFGTSESSSTMTLTGVVMYTWESPFKNEFDAPFIDQVPFPLDKWYYGGEVAIYNQGYRLALAAYRIYEPDITDTTETLYGASIGFGW